MKLHFQYFDLIWLLAALAVFVLLLIYLYRWKKKTARRIGDPELVRDLVRNFSSRLFNLKFTLVSIAFAAGVFGAMNLRKPAGPEGISRKGIDVVIALDVSKSMLATDLAPNRLDRAKQFISKLMAAMPNDRIAFVVFAGEAYLQMPLTTDHAAARMYVSSAGPDAIPQQGTVISQALRRSADAFNAAERRFKAVVLITDGEDHDPKAVETAKELSEQGLMINSIGIGSPEGANIPDPLTGQNKIDDSGTPVLTKLNEPALQELAAATNGIYVRLQDSDAAVAAVQQQLSQIDSKAYGDISLVNYTSYYFWFVAGMLLLLLIEFFIPETKKVKA